MLGKLMKYELKDTSRWLLPGYAALLVMAIINRIFMAVNGQSTFLILSKGITMTLYGCGVVAVGVLTMVVVVYRFYKNLMTDQGYLMFTLPVPTWQHIMSKLLVGMLWMVASAVVIIISVMILAFTGNDFVEIGNILGELGSVIGELGFGSVMLMLEVFILMVLGLAANNLQFYFSITVGQLAHKNKGWMAVLAYVVINIVMQIIATIIMAGVGLSNIGNASWLVQWVENAGNSPQGIMMFMSTVLGLGILVALAVNVIFFMGSDYILKNKLNLE